MQFTADSLTSALWARGGGQLLLSDLGPNYLRGSITKSKPSASGLGGGGMGLPLLSQKTALPILSSPYPP